MNVELFKVDTNNPEFQKALDLIENTNQSFFLTGKAGTGKSTFLRYIIDTVEKNFIVVAPTGIAAVNVNGMTIYSFFQFPLRPLLPQDDDIKVFSKDSEKRKIISKMDTLIIDEISMVRADIIDGIDYSLRKNGGNPNLPFGGKQVVFVGDMFQLEPVSIKSTGEYKIIKEFYKSLYFYGANIFNEVNLVSIELQKVYRQKNLEFIQLLDKVRTKEIKSEDIAKLNQRVVTDAQLKNKEFTITLTTTNGLALNVNKSKLSKLHSVLITYHANVSGEFQKGKYPTELELELKVGAQVIFIKNDAEKRWVNGTIGQVSELSEDEIKVTLENGDIYSVEKRSWENIKFQYNKEKRKIEQEIVGTFEQYPLKLAWAITIHKSQGLTFESVVIDFGRGTFASGQAYVALSRATTLEGLFLKKKIFISDIRIDKEIIEFSKAYNSNSVDEILELAKPTFKYRKNNDFERLGNFYFEKAIALWIEGDFKLAAESLSEGFKQVTCDCVLGTLVKKEKDNIISSMKSNVMNCSSQDFDFLRTIFYYFSNQENRALPFINSFLEDNEASEVGNYLKGRILISLDNDEGLEWLDKALKINDNARLNYRIGRIKEQRFNAFGLDKIYKSITLNPSSTCSHRLLKNIATKRGVKLQTNTNKLLASLFNNQETETYVSVINKLLVGGSVQLSNDTVLSASNAFNSFSHTLRSDQDLFTSDRGTVEQETIDISELFGQDFDDATTLNEQSESSQKQIQLVQNDDYDKAIKLDKNAYFNEGNVKGNLGNYKAAIEDYDKVIELDENYKFAYNNRGIAKRNLGNNQAAIEDYDKAIELDENYTSAYYGRGFAKGNLGNNQAAIEDYDKAIELDENYKFAYNNRGLAKGNLGNYKAAIEDYDKAIELDENYKSAYNNRGSAKLNLGNNQAAIEDYDKAIELDENYKSAYFYRGFTKGKLGNYKAAIEDYDKAIELDENYKFAYNNRGNAKLNLGNNQAAIEDYDKAIELDENYKFAYNNRGSAKLNLGNYKAAIEDYDKAIELDENYKGVYLNRGLAKGNLGNYKAAIEDYDKAIELDENYKSAYFYRGNAKGNLGNYKAAIEDYDKAIELDENYKSAYFYRGIAKRNLGNNQAAIEDYDKAIELDENYTSAYYGRGFAKGNLGNNQAAIEDYDKAIELDENYKFAYNNRGLAKGNLGNYKAAIEDYDKAIELDENYKSAYNNRGSAKLNLGNYKAAIEDYDKAIELDENYKSAYFYRGIAKLNLGNNQAAIEDYDKAIELDENHKSAYFYRGIAKRNLGNNQAAIEDYDKAIELDKNYTSAYFNRGIVKGELGNYKEAIENYIRVIKIVNNNSLKKDTNSNKNKQTAYENAMHNIGRLEQINLEEANQYKLIFEYLLNQGLYSEEEEYDDNQHDPNESYRSNYENPWIDVFGEGEEADTAYWNID
jgi:tetratricopeptide (TPR) repeat protein